MQHRLASSVHSLMLASGQVGWQPSRFLADRAKPRGAYALAEQPGGVNAAASWDHLAVAAQGLHPPRPRHAGAEPAPEQFDMGGRWR
jgi:hypothetical protein